MLIEIVAKAEHQQKAARALVAGFGRHGVPCAVVDGVSKAKAEVVACWGWRNGRTLAGQGKRVLVMERAYIGDRFHWISLSWDGLNGKARFPAVDDDGRRWRLAFDGALRRRRDPAAAGPVIVFGQVPNDMSLEGWPSSAWYIDAGDRLRERGLNPVFRPHPLDPHAARYRASGRAFGMEVQTGDLREALEQATAAVAWNSNSLTDAAMAGVPILAGSPGAMTWPIAGRSLDDLPRLGEREGVWANRMAFAQWEPSEIAAGIAWDALRDCMEPGTGHRFGDWRVDAESAYWPT